MSTTTVQVRRNALDQTRCIAQPAPALADGQVQVAIDPFALTANNLTYAAFGEAMQYWSFFPALDAQGQADPDWGCIPVWGFGTVRASRCPDIAVGERLYGYFPMASDVLLSPGRIGRGGFTDQAAHRAALPAVYNQYLHCAADPWYQAGSEGAQALLRPLFTTSWLLDDFLADQQCFGSATVLLSSASSKTAYGSAYLLARRPGIRRIGLTSPGNVAFCQRLGLYDQVLDYGQLGMLDPATPCVYLDFAGSAPLRRTLHTQCQALAYSCAIGGTHIAELGSSRDLPGPSPTLFFAPSQVKKRSQEWGPAVLGERLLADWQQFLARATDPGDPWLRLRHHAGAAALQAVYASLLRGGGDPQLGHTASL